MEDINTELLITLVEERPAIWDKTLDLYKDKKLKELSWREICEKLNEDFEEMETWQKQEYGKLVLRKWTQTRDSWMKSVKKHMENKRSSSGRPSRLYLFHQQMSFLNKIMDTTSAHESSDNNEKEERTSGSVNDEANVEECRTSQFEDITKFESKTGITDAQRKSRTAQVEHFTKSEVKSNISETERKRKTDLKNELVIKMIKYLDHEINKPKSVHLENRHLSFFKGLLPSLCSLSDCETLEFQSGVINVLQNIKRKKQTLLNDHSQHSAQQSNYEWHNPSSYVQSVPVRLMNASAESTKSPGLLSTISTGSEEYD